MKKTMLFSILLFAIPVVAQMGTTRFTVSDSLAISTTARDTTFATPWESVDIFFGGFSSSTATGLLRFGISSTDTTGRGHATTTHVKLKHFIPVVSGAHVRVTASSTLGIPGLKWCEFKMSAGTGYIYFIGTKKSAL